MLRHKQQQHDEKEELKNNAVFSRLPFGRPFVRHSVEGVADGQVALDGHGQRGVDGAGQRHLGQRQRPGQHVEVVAHGLVLGTDLGDGEEEEAEDDVEEVVGRQHHHQPMELELPALPGEEKEGGRVAHDAEEPDGAEQHNLEHELHGLLVDLLLLRILDEDGRVPRAGVQSGGEELWRIHHGLGRDFTEKNKVPEKFSFFFS